MSKSRLQSGQGAAIVLAVVWEQNLGGLIAALGLREGGRKTAGGRERCLATCPSRR